MPPVKAMPPVDAEAGANVMRILAGRYPGVRLVQATWLNAQVLEALFTVPDDGGRRMAMCAWICKSGTVQVWEGWNVQ